MLLFLFCLSKLFSKIIQNISIFSQTQLVILIFIETACAIENLPSYKPSVETKTVVSLFFSNALEI